ncbi:MAG TPA: DUF6122 family protein [Clostridiales bacterium]|nr:DUF6122 family protein [Clostridiales bacterium]
MLLLNSIYHNLLHILLPLSVSLRFYSQKWKTAWVIMISAYIIDLDHFLSDPVFDPDRCSIGSHILHSYPAAALYLALFFLRRFRLIAAGLLLHILTDMTDCIRIYFTS